MNQETVALEKLVAEATAVLSQTEAELDRLAKEALTQATTNGAVGQPPLVRVRQIGQQLAKLSARSKTLHGYLQDNLSTPPIDDDNWPRIKILQSQEEERTQLARELEDGVGQLLANAVFELASCRHLLDNNLSAVADGLDALQKEMEQGLADIRYMITDLEPASILGNFGLGGGVRRYLERFESRTGLKAELQIKANFGRLPGTIEVAIFRIIQEALQNVLRHAKATQVNVIFEEVDDVIQFSVVDNGCGMASDRVDLSKKNYGLARMVDYADLINGELRIFSEPEQGTQVTLSIPYHSL